MLKKTFLLILLVPSILLAQGRGTPSTLRVLTDANGYLAIAGSAQTLPTTSSVFSNTRLATDSSGNLLVVLTGGTFTGPFFGPVEADCSVVAYSFTGRTTTGLNSHAANTWNLCGGGTLGLSGNTTNILASIPIQLVGTTSSFPMIKRNSTAINFRLADDSADSPISASLITGTASLAFQASAGTSSALTYTFQNATAGLGFNSGSNGLVLWDNTNRGVGITNPNLFVASNYCYGFNDNAAVTSGTVDSQICRLAIGQIIFQRDSTHGVAIDVATDGTIKFLSRAGADTAIVQSNKFVGTGTVTAFNLTPNGSLGTPVVVGGPSTRKSAVTSAQTLATYTVGAADGSFEVSANILITTATTHSFTATVAYTDEGNTSRTVTLNFATVAGVISNAAITNVAGAVPYEGVPYHIRCKAATTITIATTGTFTTVTYNAEGIIKQTS